MPVRPGTGPPGPFVPPPPQVSFPQPTQQYPLGVIPPVVTRGYRTPTPTESPVVPFHPSRDGGAPFIPPDLGPARGSIAIPQVYQPPVPMGDDEIYIPPEPSYSTRTPSIESPRSPSLAPVVVPGFLHPPSQPPPSQLGRTPSPRSRSPTPPRFPGQPTIIVPPQPGAAPPAAPLAPSTQRLYDERPDQPVFLPPMGAQPPFQLVTSPRPGYSEPSDFGDRREGPQQPGQPIIIQPPPQTHISPGPYGPQFGPQFGPQYGPPGPGIIMTPSHPRSRSTTPTTESPRPSFIAAPFPPAVIPGAPFPGVPGVPFPAVGIQPGAPPINIVAPSRASPEPGYRSPTRESLMPYPVSRPPSRYTEGYAEGPIQPIPPPVQIPVPIPTAVHIEPEPYRYRRRGTRYDESRTPTPPSDWDRDEPREGRRPSDRRRSPGRERSPSIESPYRSPSPLYPVPVGAPVYDRGVPAVIQPPPVTHVHQYPSTYPPRSPTIASPPLTSREGEPLPHPFGAPTQYPATEQVPIGRPPTRPSRVPTIVEVTGPEPIQVYPAPDQRRLRTESARKCCIYSRDVWLIEF